MGSTSRSITRRRLNQIIDTLANHVLDWHISHM
jgi:hypothetical protein